MISPMHANFIENGDATTADALALIAEARRRAREQFGVELEHGAVARLDRRRKEAPAARRNPRRGRRERISNRRARVRARQALQLRSRAAPRAIARSCPACSLRPLAADRAADPARRPRPLRRRAHDLRVRRRPDRGRGRAARGRRGRAEGARARARGEPVACRLGRPGRAGRGGVPTVARVSLDRQFPHTLALTVGRSRSRSSARLVVPLAAAGGRVLAARRARVPACPASGSGAASTCASASRCTAPAPRRRGGGTLVDRLPRQR